MFQLRIWNVTTRKFYASHEIKTQFASRVNQNVIRSSNSQNKKGQTTDLLNEFQYWKNLGNVPYTSRKEALNCLINNSISSGRWKLAMHLIRRNHVRYKLKLDSYVIKRMTQILQYMNCTHELKELSTYLNNSSSSSSSSQYTEHRSYSARQSIPSLSTSTSSTVATTTTTAHPTINKYSKSSKDRSTSKIWTRKAKFYDLKNNISSSPSTLSSSSSPSSSHHTLMKTATNTTLKIPCHYIESMKKATKAHQYHIAYRLYKDYLHTNQLFTTELGNRSLQLLLHMNKHQECHLFFHYLKYHQLADCNTYSYMIQYYITMHRLEEAYYLYQQMQRLHIPINTIQAGITILELLILLNQEKDVVMYVFRELQQSNLIHIHTFRVMINAYVTMNQLQDALSIYQIMLDIHIEIDMFIIGNVLLEMFTMNQLYDKAMDTFNTMEIQKACDDKSYTLIMKGYMTTNRLDEAQSMYNRLKQSSITTISSDSCLVIIKLLLLTKQYTDILPIIQYLKMKSNDEAFIYCTLIKEYMSLNMINEAYEIYSLMKITPYTINRSTIGTILIDFLMSIKKYEEAINVLEILVNNKLINSIHFSIIIHWYLKHHFYQKAIYMYDYMTSHTTLLHYMEIGNIIVELLIMTKQYENTEEFMIYLEKMKYANIQIYGSMIKVYVQQNMYQQAYNIYLEHMKDKDISYQKAPCTYSLLKMLLYLNQEDEFMDLLSLLEKQECMTSQIYSIIIDYCMSCKYHQLAYTLYTRMRAYKPEIIIDRIDTGNIILNVLVSDKEYMNEACTLFQQLQQSNLAECFTYIIMMKGYSFYGNIDAAKNIYHQMKQHNMMIKDVKEGNGLLKVLLKLGAYTECHTEFEWMKTNQMADCTSYVTLIEGYSYTMNAYSIKTIEKLYSEMMTLKIDISDFDTGALLVHLLFSMKLEDKALNIFHIMRIKELLKYPLCIYLMEKYMTSKRLDKALYIYHTLCQQSVAINDSQGGSVILTLLITLNNIEEAMKVFDTLENTDMTNSQSYGLMIYTHIKEKRINDAYQIYLRMKAKCIQIEDGYYGNIVIHMLLHLGYKNEALNMFIYLDESYIYTSREDYEDLITILNQFHMTQEVTVVKRRLKQFERRLIIE